MNVSNTIDISEETKTIVGLTNQEAIQWLQMFSSKPVKWDDYSGETKEIREKAEKHICEAFKMAIDALKKQEPREPHYTRLDYLVNGLPVSVNHPECPRCYENGLVLWDAEIPKGELFCKRCGQAVKWG